jgi:hypothetical protein
MSLPVSLELSADGVLASQILSFSLIQQDLFTMSAQQGSVRKRKDASVVGKAKEPAATGITNPRDPDLDALVKASMEVKTQGVEWDYRIAITVITILAFVTRFWGISHPNEVVFDEVHFGKVIAHKHFPSPHGTQLTSTLIVCLLLPRANLLLRCSSSFWKASLCPDGLVCGL